MCAVPTQRYLTATKLGSAVLNTAHKGAATALLCVLLFCAINAHSIASTNVNESGDKQSISLSNECPKGFSLEDHNVCRLRTLYQFYSSVQGGGVGGTQTSLPQYRDGFSPQQIDLGRYLFFDPFLSADNSIACASCHQPDKGFSDGLARSVGINGQIGTRSAPSLWNSAFLTRFNWDASANSFEQQVQNPLFSAHEMNNEPQQLLDKLHAQPNYQHLFSQAFKDGVSLANVYTALAAFQSSLISLNSRYDQYAHGNHDVLNAAEIRGMNVFRSFVARCAECHTPPLFTNNQIAVIGVPEPEETPFDKGAEKTFSERKLRGGFKVPTLRNINLTAPYMHQGNFDRLRDVTAFYNNGRGHAMPEDDHLYIHWHISEPQLTDAEIDDVVTFMGTLTDEKFIPNIPNTLPSGLELPAVINRQTQTAANREPPKRSIDAGIPPFGE